MEFHARRPQPCIARVDDSASRLEQEFADLVGVPYPRVSQIALIPFAYTVGTDFSEPTRERSIRAALGCR